MAEKPLIAAKTPVKVSLDGGKEYYWCACGRSASQPFCDGSHQGTGLEPVSFKAETSRTAYFCGCKRTANPPFCDGTHSTL